MVKIVKFLVHIISENPLKAISLMFETETVGPFSGFPSGYAPEWNINTRVSKSWYKWSNLIISNQDNRNSFYTYCSVVPGAVRINVWAAFVARFQIFFLSNFSRENNERKLKCVYFRCKLRCVYVNIKGACILRIICACSLFCSIQIYINLNFLPISLEG